MSITVASSADGFARISSLPYDGLSTRTGTVRGAAALPAATAGTNEPSFVPLSLKTA